MLAMTAASYSANYYQASHSQLGTWENTRANEQKAQAITQYYQAIAKRYGTAQAGTNHVYVLATLDDKVPGIVAVNMDSGQADYEVALNDKEPDYIVDEVSGRVYHLKNNKELVAMSID